MAAVSGRKARVAFVNTHPIQYFSPLYRFINTSPDIEAVPVYLSDHGLRESQDPGFGQTVKWDIDLLSGINPVFARGAERRVLETGATKMIVPDVWRIIRNGNFDAVVVHGHRIGANHVAWAAAKSKGLPVFTRGETHLELIRSQRKIALRDWLMPKLYSVYDGVLSIGTANTEYYRYMGVPDARISLFPYSVDNDRMIEASTLSPEARAAYRKTLGLSADRPALLYASKFQQRKHPDDLIRACATLIDEGLPVDLVLAGSGEMDAELRALAAQHPELKTVFPGFINQSELPVLFGACDIFSLPSENEPWGLIINEAMCAGLPIVAAREIGSVPDLVSEGETGMTFTGGDLRGLTDAIRPLVADAATRQRIGNAARARIRNWSYAECLMGLRDALTKAHVLPG
jgi:glycosyltransferase involved in cell wall biosynthesis